MTVPTWPVAPTTLLAWSSLRRDAFALLHRVESERGVQVAHGVGDPSARSTHEMRIEAVEIISMLMPCSDSVSNINAVTPGLDFMPAPTMETRPMLSSVVTSARRYRPSPCCTRRARPSRSVLATVKEMSVIPLVPVFWTIMSTLMPGWRARGRAGPPRPVGRARRPR
jgi:hypothetical protein